METQHLFAIGLMTVVVCVLETTKTNRVMTSTLILIGSIYYGDPTIMYFAILFLIIYFIILCPISESYELFNKDTDNNPNQEDETRIASEPKST